LKQNSERYHREFEEL